MVTIAISDPATDVLGWFQMLEREFIRKLLDLERAAGPAQVDDHFGGFDFESFEMSFCGRPPLAQKSAAADAKDGAPRVLLTPGSKCAELDRAGGRLRFGPTAGVGFGRSLCCKLPWFRSGFQWRVQAIRRERPRAPAPSAFGEGDFIRRARHFRRLSGYL
jgi:hypothetical protein